MAKYLDENGLLYYDKAQKARLDKKVDKVEGKGLSTNDYTTEEKTKLAGIEENAQVNKIESIKVNGVTATITGKEAAVDIDPSKIDHIKVNNVEQTITDKTVNIAVPTKLTDLENDDNFVKDANYVHTDNNYTQWEKKKLDELPDLFYVNDELLTVGNNGQLYIYVPTQVSELTNDSKYQTEDEVTAAINEAVKDIVSFEFKILKTDEYNQNTLLPTIDGESGYIYLVPKYFTETNNIYIEYVFVNGAFEKIGDTTIDLSNYWNKTNLTAITNPEIDTILETVVA